MVMKNSAYVLILLVTTFTTACIKQQAPEVKPLTRAPAHIVELSEQEYLTLSDLPVPLGFHLVGYEPDTPMSYCHYQGSLALHKIEDFLYADAERNGWRFDNLATPQVKTYLIAKPGKIAMIMLERKKLTSHIHINLKTQAS